MDPTTAINDNSDLQSVSLELASVLDGKFYIYVAPDCSHSETVATSVFAALKQKNTSEGAASETVSQEQFDKHITNYFIHSMAPLQYLEDSHFKQMFSALSIDKLGLNILSRASLESQLEDSYVRIRKDIKSQLQLTKHVCLTTEYTYRSSVKQCLITISCHWIDSDLKRKSSTLSCSPFYGNCSQIWFHDDRLRIRLAGISYLRNFIREGESNAFRSSQKMNEAIGKDEWHLEDGMVVLPDIMISDVVHLQPCPLTLVEFYKMSHSIRINTLIKKCNLFWDAAEHPRFAKVIQNILGYSIARPENYISPLYAYNSLRKLLSIQDKYIQVLGLQLNNPLQEEDFLYIREYLKCYKPIADATNILKDNNNLFYGITLPCLLSLRKKLIRNCNDSYEFCQNVAVEYLEKLEEKFDYLFDLTTDSAVNAAIATMSYPKFKDKWLTCIDPERHDVIRAAFQRAVIEEIKDNAEQRTAAAERKDSESFFEFDEAVNDMDADDIKAKVLITRYLADKQTDLSMLHRHKEIKNVFIKYNTPLSIQCDDKKLVLYKNIGRIDAVVESDDILEKIVVVKSNTT